MGGKGRYLLKRILETAVPILLFALAAPSAIAQENSGNNMSIPESQLSAVRERCEELQVQQGVTGSQQPETTEPERATNQPDSDGQEDRGGRSFDLSAITLQDCIDSGMTAQQPAD